ncbi:MAG: hypothetical protein LBP68_07050, partial [Acidobacteriota bacterium]|nr:hypothetical protein [Acidobacteriota bacterium]
SGGSPDEKHRADNRIEEYCCFLSSQGGAKLIVTVTADQELRAGVRDNGSRLIYPSDFMALARL